MYVCAPARLSKVYSNIHYQRKESFKKNPKTLALFLSSILLKTSHAYFSVFYSFQNSLQIYFRDCHQLLYSPEVAEDPNQTVGKNELVHLGDEAFGNKMHEIWFYFFCGCHKKQTHICIIPIDWEYLLISSTYSFGWLSCNWFSKYSKWLNNCRDNLYIWCLYIHGTYMTANNFTTNNVLLFCLRFENSIRTINLQSQYLGREKKKYFASLVIWRQNHSKLSQNRCSQLIW